MNRTPVSVAIAVVRDSSGRVLVGVRPNQVPLAGFAEFPGGKVESGESPEAAAIRECREETGLEVSVTGSATTVDQAYEHADLRLHFFHCAAQETHSVPRPPFRFVTLEEVARLQFPPANRAILEELLAPLSAVGPPRPGLSPEPDWRDRLAHIVDTMKAISSLTDPQEMVREYAQRIEKLVHVDCRISLSRRGLTQPQFRITRSTTWPKELNPWQTPHLLPVLSGGLLADLIYGNEPVIIDDLEVSPADPAHEYLAAHRSLLAIPNYDQGQALNAVVLLQRAPAAFDREQIPDIVWRSNLFGRATTNLVLRDELQRAYHALDREMKAVGAIQRSLLPTKMPHIPDLQLAAYYQPAQRAGGDYYDFFPLPEGKWGIFIADVSGHGTPAAVLMAVTHCIAHTHPGPPIPAASVLGYLNDQLAIRYSHFSSTFVTAFYGIYDPHRKVLTYSSAGHNPPRLKRCQDGSVWSLDRASGLPLGVQPHWSYEEHEVPLQAGDQLVFYTDGITEALNPAGELFGTARLDAELSQCTLHAQSLLDSILRAVEEFSQGRNADDDRTMIVARVG